MNKLAKLFSFGGSKAYAAQPESKRADYDRLLKLLLIGDHHSGKSSLLKRFSDDTFFDEQYLSTIGVEFATRILDLDGKVFKLQLWDTAGQERYRSITTSYYRGAAGIVICFSVTHRPSFDHLTQWIEEARRSNSAAQLIIVGTKCDLQEQRQVTPEEARHFAASQGLMYYETSAKENTNVFETFVALCGLVNGAAVSFAAPTVPKAVNLGDAVELFDDADLFAGIDETKSNASGNIKHARADTNVFRLELASMIASECPVITGDPTMCTGCGVLFSCHSALIIPPKTRGPSRAPAAAVGSLQSLEVAPAIHPNFEHCAASAPEGDSLWRCEFCGTANLVDMEAHQVPQGPLAEYLVCCAPPSFSSHCSSSAPLVLFVIDTSGSMCVSTQLPGSHRFQGAERRVAAHRQLLAPGDEVYRPSQASTYVSRLQTVQAVAQEEILRLAREAPQNRVAIVSFADEVAFYGDSCVTVAGDSLSSWDKLEQVALQELRVTRCVRDTHQELLERLWALEECGQTALGPALKLAVECAGTAPLSTVHVFTDGLANRGIGALDCGAPRSFVPFYTELAERTRLTGCTVNVVTLGDAECRMENLSVLCGSSGGQVERVDQLSAMRGCLVGQGATLGANAMCIVCLPRALHFRGEFDDELERRNFLVRDCGTVRERDAFSFAYGFRPVDQVGPVDAHTLPFQAQLLYQRPDGATVLRVATDAVPLTKDRAEAEACANARVLATHAVNRAARSAKQGGAIEESRLQMRSVQRLFVRNNMDQREDVARWASEVNAFDQVLQRQQPLVAFNDESATRCEQMEQAQEMDLFG